LRYLRWDGRGLCLGAGKTRSQKNAAQRKRSRKMPQNPTRQVHAMLGVFAIIEILFFV
jgi:hypothetical protein